MITTAYLINEFLKKQFILSLTCQTMDNQELGASLWSANCFYITANFISNEGKNEVETRLLDLFFMSSLRTKHGQILQNNPDISGTIATSTRKIEQIEGIQYNATVQLINEEDSNYQSILSHYQNEFEEAKQMIQPLWRLKFYQVKYTRNAPKFGEKFYWPCG